MTKKYQTRQYLILHRQSSVLSLVINANIQFRSSTLNLIHFWSLPVVRAFIRGNVTVGAVAFAVNGFAEPCDMRL